MVYAMDPNNSVIKSLWCIVFILFYLFIFFILNYLSLGLYQFSYMNLEETWAQEDKGWENLCVGFLSKVY